MDACCQLSFVRPRWEGVVSASINGVAGAVVSGLFLQSATAFQGAAISVISNIAAYILVNMFIEEIQFDNRLFTYVLSHLITVPLLAWGSVALGWSISTPGMVVLAVVNCGVSILGRIATDNIEECILNY